MERLYSWPWVQTQVAQTLKLWHASAERLPENGRRYGAKEQRNREKAYDRALRTVEREARGMPRAKAQRLATQERLIASFAHFSATALNLEPEAIQLLTCDFLPVGTELSQWARKFDPSLSMADIIQACRNAWTACGLQSLLGEQVRVTPAVLGYSLLYPYSDNYLDREDVSSPAKLQFSRRFRDRLCGEQLPAQDRREASVWRLVRLIEEQYLRWDYPQVYDCLLAIHRAQEESMAQLTSCASSETELLRISCAKGGTSVLADACLARGSLNVEESRFAFEWGVLLQLGDDLQDVREDMHRGSVTLFSRAAAAGRPLDDLVTQLLSFSDGVGARMDNLPSGTRMLKNLLRTSWRSLIIGAVAESHGFFSPGFIDEVEPCSPFGFQFLRARHHRLVGRQGLYAVLFEAFLEAREGDDSELPLPDDGKLDFLEPVAAMETVG